MRDVIEFYGQLPRETMRAVVVTLDGKIVGIGGLARDGWAYRLFSEYKPELEPYLGSVTVWRAAKRLIEIMAALECPVYAIARDREGERILTRIGFVRQGELWWRV